MSWLLFMDESGHDHRNTPCEVRGGFAIHASRLWDFHREFRLAEKKAFGKYLSDFNPGTDPENKWLEVKGSKILENKRFQWAAQSKDLLSSEKRHEGVLDFLIKSRKKVAPSRLGFTAFGQASLLMSDEIFRLLQKHEAVVFASMIPRGIKPPKDYRLKEHLRKDHTFLLERFFYFLEQKQEHGLLVLDETEKHADRKFIERLHGYHTKTRPGRQRTQWIVPSPLFVNSMLSPAIQAADVCIYCVNWGFRLPKWGFHGNSRKDISQRYGAKLKKLMFQGSGYRDGETYFSDGIFYLPDPYTSRDKTH